MITEKKLICDHCGHTSNLKHPDNPEMEMIAKAWAFKNGEQFCCLMCQVEHQKEKLSKLSI